MGLVAGGTPENQPRLLFTVLQELCPDGWRDALSSMRQHRVHSAFEAGIEQC